MLIMTCDDDVQIYGSVIDVTDIVIHGLPCTACMQSAVV